MEPTTNNVDATQGQHLQPTCPPPSSPGRGARAFRVGSHPDASACTTPQISQGCVVSCESVQNDSAAEDCTGSAGDAEVERSSRRNVPAHHDCNRTPFNAPPGSISSGSRPRTPGASKDDPRC